MRRAVGVLAAIALLASGLVTGCTSSSGSRDGTVPTTSAAQRLLDRHAAAVRGHDASQFVGDIDPSAGARSYRDEQRREFANLARVPLSRWSYDLVGSIRDTSAIRAATKRYGAPALLLHVTLNYSLRGIDTVPSRHDLYLSFVERSGRTYLAGDDALATQGSTSWLGPWHYGPLVVASGSSSLVLGPPADRSRLPGLAAAVDAAIAAVTRVWGTGWSQRVAVLIPASDAEFHALSGSGVADVSAVAVTDGIDSGTGRPYGQRLVLNPAELDELTLTGQGIVLRHEITHLASAADTADITPRWLVEGFADYVGNLGSGQNVRTAAAELSAAAARGNLPGALPSDGAFAANGAALARTYEQSWLACRLIAHRVGQRGLVRFYRFVGTALEPRAPAVADGFRTVLHETQGVFTTQWRAYLNSELS